MADGIPPFNEAANLARVGAGFSGNPFFKEPNLAPAMTALSPEASWPETVQEKLQHSKTDAPAVTDPWVVRRPNGMM